jgi:hypothetical protein
MHAVVTTTAITAQGSLETFFSSCSRGRDCIEHYSSNMECPWTFQSRPRLQLLIHFLGDHWLRLLNMLTIVGLCISNPKLRADWSLCFTCSKFFSCVEKYVVIYFVFVRGHEHHQQLWSMMHANVHPAGMSPNQKTRLRQRKRKLMRPNFVFPQGGNCTPSGFDFRGSFASLPWSPSFVCSFQAKCWQMSAFIDYSVALHCGFVLLYVI